MIAFVCSLIWLASAQGPALAGEWLGWFPVEGGFPKADRFSPKWTLTLKDDSTFTSHLESHVMMDLVVDTKGTYKRSGDKVVFSGKSGYKMDDGYKKDSGTRPFAYTMTYLQGALVLNEGGQQVIFARNGTKPPHGLLSQRPEPKKSDPRAMKILRDVENCYASLKAYSDDGEMSSDGTGFRAKHARFLTRFVRGKGFRFEVVAVDTGREYNRNIVWSRGKKAWMYMEDVGGKDERPLAAGLSTISPTSGYEAMLIPELLMPQEFRGNALESDFKDIQSAQDTRIDGKPCEVLRLTNRHAMTLTIWIDKKSRLIIRADEGSESIRYTPKANPALKEEDLTPSVKS